MKAYNFIPDARNGIDESAYSLSVRDPQSKRSYCFYFSWEEVQEYAEIFLEKARKCNSQEDMIGIDFNTDRGVYHIDFPIDQAFKIGHGLKAMKKTT